MRLLFRIFIAFAIILLFTSNILSQQTMKEKASRRNIPINIKSDTLESDNKSQIITFIGNVVAVQGDVTIHSEILIAQYTKTKEIKEITAKGNVKIVQGERIATGDRAVFYNNEQKIILSGNAMVRQDEDTVTGEKVTVFLEQERSIVEAGKNNRVEAILYPKDKKEEKIKK